MGRRNYGTNMDGLAAAVAEAEASVGGDGGGQDRLGGGCGRVGTGQRGAGTGPLGFKPFGGVSSPASGGQLNVGEPGGSLTHQGPAGLVEEMAPSPPAAAQASLTDPPG